MSTFTYNGLVYKILSQTTVEIDRNLSYTGPSDIVIQNTVLDIMGGIFYTVVGITTNAFYNGSNTFNITSFDASACSSFTYFGDSSFEGCRNLRTVYFPSSLTTIYKDAFYSCINLTTIIFPSTFSSLTSIGNFAFSNAKLTNFTFPSSLTNIGKNAFQSNNLSSVNLQNCSSLFTLNDYTFGNCRLLSSIYLPTNLTTILDYVFNSCSILTSITFPSTLSSVSIGAFKDCTTLGNVTFSGTTIPSFQIDSFTRVSGSTAYYQKGTTNLSYLQGFNFFTNYVEIVEPPYPCFKEGSKIETDKGYINIEELKKGDLVKTLRDGYKPITLIGKREISHPSSKERIKDQLYQCSQNEYPEILEPLVITGCHCILVDNFKSEEEKEKVIEVNGDTFVTDNKYRLPACADNRASVYEIPGDYTIFHIALENDDYYMNYGIYANGLLVETCSKRYLKELSGMDLLS